MAHTATHRTNRASLVSVLLTAIAITVNHRFTLGTGALFLGAVLVLVPSALWFSFERTGGRAFRTFYLLMSAWIVVGFGLFKGFRDIVLPVFAGTLLSSLSPAYPRPVFGPFWFEMTGIVMFIGSLFVLYYGVQMIPVTRRHIAAVATVSVATLTAVTVAYATADRDRWNSPAQDIVKIGVIVPTRGPYALLGGSFVKAVQMAKDDLKNTKYQYELVIRDSGPDPAKARDVVRQVISVDKVDAIVGGISLIGQVTKPFATDARIPHLCVCTVSWIGDGGYNFTNIPSPEAEGLLWTQEAKRRGIKTVALITQDYPSINNHVKALKIEAALAGLVVSDEQQFPESVTEFRPLIERAERTHPDVYYVEALEPGLDVLGQQLLDSGIRNISAVVAPSLSNRPELFEGTWYTDSNLRDIAFKRRFEQKYPDTRFATHMMPYAYDSVTMIVRAFESGQNPSVYLRALRSYDGTAGVLTKAPGSGHFASRPAVWTIADGKPALLHQ